MHNVTSGDILVTPIQIGLTMSTLNDKLQSALNDISNMRIHLQNLLHTQALLVQDGIHDIAQSLENIISACKTKLSDQLDAADNILLLTTPDVTPVTSTNDNHVEPTIEVTPVEATPVLSEVINTPSTIEVISPTEAPTQSTNG